MNLLKALAAVSSMTLVSRVLGFIRDSVIARTFGAGLYTDAFFVAFKIPNLLRRLFAEGAFSQAFVPILAEYKNTKGQEATHHLIDHTASLLAVILLIVSIIGVLAAPVIVFISAPGFANSADKFEVTIQLLRVVFPYIFFISLVSLASGILNTYGKFSLPAITPALLNLAMIACALWLAPHVNPPILALSIAVLIGGALQLAFLAPPLIKLKLFPRFRLNLKDQGVWRILKLMGPAVFGVSVGQISLIINTIFASFLITGSVSWLYYADRLMEFPTGLLGAALGTILLPSLAKHYSNQSSEEYSKLLDWGLRLTLMLALPAAVALAVMAVPLISTLFFYGKFSANDLWMTREALIAYSIGLTGLIMVKILAPGFYARQDIKTPVKIAIISLICTQLMNLVFIWKLRHAGLALAVSLGACVNASLLYWQLRKQKIYHPQPAWGRFLLRLVIALMVMATVLWFAVSDTDPWLLGELHQRLIRLLGLTLLGAASYFGTLWLVGVRVKDFAKRGAE